MSNSRLGGHRGCYNEECNKRITTSTVDVGAMYITDVLMHQILLV